MDRYVPCKDTLDFMVDDKTYFSEEQSSPIAHYEILDNIYVGDKHFKSAKASRGLAKTTLLSTKLPLLTALSGEFKGRPSYYCLITAETAAQAEAIISDILSLYEDSAALQLKMKLDRAIAGELQFSVGGRKYFIVGKGSGAKLRGIKRQRRRPDIIISDDLTSEDTSLNPARREKLKRWFWKSLVPSREPTNYTFISVFTPLHQADVSLELHEASFCDSIDIPIADELPPNWESMKAAWPSRFPVEYIRETYEQYAEKGRVAEFLQEHFLQLVSDESAIFNTNKISYEPIKLTANAMIYVNTDLAISQKTSADRSVCIVIAFDEGVWKLLDIYSDRVDPTTFMDHLFRVQRRYSPLGIGLETVGYQQAFKHHLEQEMMQRDVYMSIEPLKDNLHVAKSTRIYGLTSVINTGNLVINEELLDSPALQRLVEQIELATREGILAAHDDEVDCLAGFTQLDPVEVYQARDVEASLVELPMELQTEDDYYY